MTTSSSNLSATSESQDCVGFADLPVSRVVFDRQTINQAIDRLAVQINVDLAGTNPVFLSVLHGGLPFTGDLLMRFQGACDLGYVHVGRYGSEQSGGELEWHREPSAEGETLAALRARALELGAREVRAAVLVRKAVDHCVSHAEYIALEAPDEFLFGYGMDIDGQLRNLPEIRAVIGAEGAA